MFSHALYACFDLGACADVRPYLIPKTGGWKSYLTACFTMSVSFLGQDALIFQGIPA
jgi:hypothetical protein